MFNPTAGMADNSMISVYPFGDEYYTFTESPIIHRIDPKSLETLNKVNNLMIFIRLLCFALLSLGFKPESNKDSKFSNS